MDVTSHATLDHAGAWVALIVGLIAILGVLTSGLWFIAGLSHSVRQMASDLNKHTKRVDDAFSKVDESIEWCSTHIAKLYTEHGRADERLKNVEQHLRTTVHREA